MSFFRIVGIPVFLMIIEYFILSFLLNRNLNLILKINNIFIIVLIIDGITFVVGKVILYNLNYPTMYQIDIITIINMIILLSFMLLFSIFIKKMQDKMDRRIAI